MTNQDQEDSIGSPRRGCFAFLAAAVAPALAAVLLDGRGAAFIPVFIAALIHVALLALPLYLALDLRYRDTFPRVVGAAFLVGAIPVPLMAFLSLLFSGYGGVDVLGVAALTALLLGGFGACGGIAFWLVLNARLPGRR